MAARGRIARTLLARVAGLLGTRELPEGEGLVLSPCNSIHMCGMRYPIDAVFTGRDGAVVRIYHGLRPWSVTPIIRGAVSVVELPAGTAERAGLEVGDRLEIEPAAGVEDGPSA
ncbi:MAG TPA: DUF192 domain-containing protein [bacterium]